LNRNSYELKGKDTSFVLSKLEYLLMELFMLNQGKYLPTETLLEKVWGYETDAELGIVWVYISYLRKKISAISDKVEIQVKRNVGYKLEVKK
ncbi:MAG: winged helix-turn-helix domain-containing protein, partial [Lachnospiraceae bacterium]|nr:winged helix-turn-helix domain-containing protein [Lachnospiraceae bacterium]